MSKFFVLTVGDCEIDVFLKIKDSDLDVIINKDSNELCFPYGQKILVDNGEFLIGGGAANVSVGLSRLGLLTGLVAEIGDDELSQKVLNSLAKEKVDTLGIIKTKGESASFSVGISFKGDRTLFVHHIEREHKFYLENMQADWVYLGSLGSKWQEAYRKTLEFVQSSSSKLIFAPGTTQIEVGYNEISNVLKVSDILFLNKEEAVKVLGIKYQVSSIKELLEKLKNIGPKVVVITDGENGSHAIGENGEIFSQGIVQSQVVEKTGAGDAYVSGFLAAIIQGEDIEKAMRWGSVNAASVIGKIGAQAGLLTKEGIEKKL